MRPDGQCRSCHRPIRWAITSTTGVRMPLDPDAVATGNLVVVAWLDRVLGAEVSTPVVAVNAANVSPLTAYRYVSHFVTCPQAATHRRRK